MLTLGPSPWLQERKWGPLVSWRALEGCVLRRAWLCPSPHCCPLWGSVASTRGLCTFITPQGLVCFLQALLVSVSPACCSCGWQVGAGSPSLPQLECTAADQVRPALPWPLHLWNSAAPSRDSRFCSPGLGLVLALPFPGGVTSLGSGTSVSSLGCETLIVLQS